MILSAVVIATALLVSQPNRVSAQSCELADGVIRNAFNFVNVSVDGEPNPCE